MSVWLLLYACLASFDGTGQPRFENNPHRAPDGKTFHLICLEKRTIMSTPLPTASVTPV